MLPQGGRLLEILESDSKDTSSKELAYWAEESGPYSAMELSFKPEGEDLVTVSSFILAALRGCLLWGRGRRLVPF